MAVPYTNANPILYDNDEVLDVYTDDYLMALASVGAINLRGLCTSSSIAPHNPYVTAEDFDRMHAQRVQSVAAARTSEMANIPDPILGVEGHLVVPGSGNIDDTVSIGSAGSSKIIVEALAASPSVPLVVVCGGPLTTIADAYLRNPSIAANLIVAWIGGIATAPYTMSDYNGWADGWAARIVAERLRLVTFPAVQAMVPDVPRTQLTTLPDCALRAFMLTKELNTDTNRPNDHDADGPPAVATMSAAYVTSQAQVRYAGMSMTTWAPVNYNVPYFTADAGGNVTVITGVNVTAGSAEWWRALSFALTPAYTAALTDSFRWTYGHTEGPTPTEYRVYYGNAAGTYLGYTAVPYGTNQVLVGSVVPGLGTYYARAYAWNATYGNFASSVEIRVTVTGILLPAGFIDFVLE